MNSTMFGGRSASLVRIAVIFLLIVAGVMFRDTWLPHMHLRRNPSFEEFAAQKILPTTFNSKSEVMFDPTPQPPPPIVEDSRANFSEDEECKRLPGADKVMVMLKTGATEVYQKLPTHFMTTFKCIPNYMIFSDLEQKFGNITIHDAIAPIGKITREEHEDFKLYREIEKWQREGQDMNKLRGGDGWNLDKWKFLPMFHQVFETASEDIEWFVMMEADTSISWLNLLLWLHTMDAKEPYYLGAQNMLDNNTFAHGGSGIVISRKAADTLEAARYNAGKEIWDQRWEKETALSCCGDEIVALAFKSVDIDLTPAWPIIQGETISTLDFTSRHWCRPAVTWHHVSPIQVDQYWQFQLDWAQEHGWNMPYLHRDIFDHFLAQHVSVNRTSWNNLSNDQKFAAPPVATEDDPHFDSLKDYQQRATRSEAECAEACIIEGSENCIQWMFMPGRCHLGKDIRFGGSDERESQHWNCGWIQERIEGFKKKMEGCDIAWSG